MKRSTMTALASPPPMQSVARPRRAFRCFERMKQRHENAAPLAPRGCPERNRAAVHIHSGRIQPGHLVHGQGHHGKRLVDLEEVDILARQAGLC